MRRRLPASRHPRALSSGVAGSQPSSVLRSAPSGCATNESYFGLQLWLERRKEAPHLEPSRKDKHARAGDSCEMPLAIAAPNTIKSSMLGVDISYIIRSSHSC
jgi:hypothetical protein